MPSTQQPAIALNAAEPTNDATAATQTTANADETWKKANSTYDANSLAPLVGEGSGAPANENERRKSWIKRVFHHEKDGDIPKRKSIADSGPLIFVVDPKTGNEVLVKNPHWPNEDSWMREKETEGKWAFGSMMGQQGVDFGGTVG